MDTVVTEQKLTGKQWHFEIRGICEVVAAVLCGFKHRLENQSA